jgi:hypothetical protein
MRLNKMNKKEREELERIEKESFKKVTREFAKSSLKALNTLVRSQFRNDNRRKLFNAVGKGIINLSCFGLSAYVVGKILTIPFTENLLSDEYFIIFLTLIVVTPSLGFYGKKLRKNIRRAKFYKSRVNHFTELLENE